MNTLHQIRWSAALEFSGFFDFNQLAFRDNRYGRVFVKAWPANPDAAGRSALIEAQYVRYLNAQFAARHGCAGRPVDRA